MTGVAAIVGYVLRESVRRRVFYVVLALTAAFLALYWLGVRQAFTDVRDFVGPEQLGVDPVELAGGTLLGLSMFGTLFLGVVLAVFLTLGAVRGDAERGLLQPLIVRPIGRAQFLLARFLGAAAVSAIYVVVVFAGTVLITGAVGDWWPDRLIVPALGLAGGVIIVAGLSLLGSVFLSSTANGIAVFMVFGAGLVAGLLGQIGDALNSETLENVARIASWALPFEALYQEGLSALTADTTGITAVIIQLGPFGGAQDAGPLLWPWALAYLVLIGALALAGFARKDL